MYQTWSIIGRPMREEMKSRVEHVVRLAVGGPFAPYLRLSRDLVRVHTNPLAWSPKQASTALRQLLGAQKSLVESLRSGDLQLALPLPD